MKRGILLLSFTALFAAPAVAQEIVEKPICFNLINEAPYGAYGNISTDYYTDPAKGTRAKHRSQFRLQAAGSKDPEKGFPTDRAEFCSYGPFFPGRQLELNIVTLFPIFSCKTSIEAGDVVIKGMRDEEGIAKTWAECL